MESQAELNYLETLLPLVAVVFIIAIGVVLMVQQFRKSLFKQQLAKETLKNQHQLELLQTSIEVEENERNRIAQNLHDELGAALSISRMHLLRLESLGKKEQQAAIDELPEVRKYIEAALASTRRISHELMPAHLRTLGLVKALQVVCDWAENANGLHATIIATGNLSKLPWQTSLAVYRVFVELLNNSMKHAQATFAELKLDIHDDILHAEYWDDGKGLPNETRHTGMGLKGIEGRVRALNGNSEFGNRSEGGFFASMHIPIIQS